MEKWSGGIAGGSVLDQLLESTFMYACTHCGSTEMFLAFKDGSLVKVLEDNEDVEGLDSVLELLCSACNEWFPNPTMGEDALAREMEGELVTITGLKGKGTIKTVSTGLRFPFHYSSYQTEIATQLAEQSSDFVEGLREFVSRHDHILAIRAKEEGNPNTWVYRIDHKRLWKRLRAARS
jgi:hypothetical protein